MTKTSFPRLRFREFDGEWKNDKLNRISSYVDYRGKTPKLSSEGFQLITASNIRKGYIDYNADKKYISVNDYDDVMHRGKPNKGDVLVTTEAPLGNVATVDNVNIALAQRVIKFRGETVGNKYLSYCMMTPTFQKNIFSKSTGGTVKGIKGSTLVAEQINFPLDKEEQQKIGSFFTNIDKLIELQIKKLEQLKKLKRGYLQNMFPQDGESEPRLRFSGFSGEWKKKKIGDISSSSKGNGLSKDDINDDRQGFPVIHYADIYKFDNIVSNVIHWSEKDEGKVIPNNSVIFPMSDVTPNGLAKCSVVNLKNVKAGGDVLIFSMKQGISAEYTSYFISANKKKILRLVSGTSVKHISSKSINNVDILLPNLSEQNKISEFFKNLDQMISNQNDKIDELRQQKKAYLQKMFI